MLWRMRLTDMKLAAKAIFEKATKVSLSLSLTHSLPLKHMCTCARTLYPHLIGTAWKDATPEGGVLAGCRGEGRGSTKEYAEAVPGFRPQPAENVPGNSRRMAGLIISSQL